MTRWCDLQPGDVVSNDHHGYVWELIDYKHPNGNLGWKCVATDDKRDRIGEIDPIRWNHLDDELLSATGWTANSFEHWVNKVRKEAGVE